MTVKHSNLPEEWEDLLEATKYFILFRSKIEIVKKYGGWLGFWGILIIATPFIPYFLFDAPLRDPIELYVLFIFGGILLFFCSYLNVAKPSAIGSLINGIVYFLLSAIFIIGFFVTKKIGIPKGQILIFAIFLIYWSLKSFKTYRSINKLKKVYPKQETVDLLNNMAEKVNTSDTKKNKNIIGFWIKELRSFWKVGLYENHVVMIENNGDGILLTSKDSFNIITNKHITEKMNKCILKIDEEQLTCKINKKYLDRYQTWRRETFDIAST